MYAPLIGFCEDCAVSCARVKLVRHLDHVSVLLTSHADFTNCKQFFFIFPGLENFRHIFALSTDLMEYLFIRQFYHEECCDMYHICSVI